jgi:hypothetical protein
LRKAQEAAMAGILHKFHVEHGVHGARIVTRGQQLTPNCTAEAEIDTAIQMLKDDLDACAKAMKRLIALERRGSMFEGWAQDAD